MFGKSRIFFTTREIVDTFFSDRKKEGKECLSFHIFQRERFFFPIDVKVFAYAPPPPPFCSRALLILSLRAHFEVGKRRKKIMGGKKWGQRHTLVSPMILFVYSRKFHNNRKITDMLVFSSHFYLIHKHATTIVLYNSLGNKTQITEYDENLKCMKARTRYKSIRIDFWKNNHFDLSSVDSAAVDGVHGVSLKINLKYFPFKKVGKLIYGLPEREPRICVWGLRGGGVGGLVVVRVKVDHKRLLSAAHRVLEFSEHFLTIPRKKNKIIGLSYCSSSSKSSSGSHQPGTAAKLAV